MVYCPAQCICNDRTIRTFATTDLASVLFFWDQEAEMLKKAKTKTINKVYSLGWGDNLCSCTEYVSC